MFRWDTRKRAIMNDKKFPSLFKLRVNEEPPVKCKWHKFRNMERALEENEWIRENLKIIGRLKFALDFLS